jgi:FMN phosphatase YigB (HAD superfamily)
LPDKKIKAVLFDLGETLLNFGQVNTTRLFRQGAISSYDFLKNSGQPVGSFNYYYWRNLIALRIWRWLSNITGRDFDTLALLRKAGTKRGVKLNPEQWRHLAWLWYEPLSKIGRAEPKTKETLAVLKNLGLKLGIVSNTFVNGCSLDKHLKQLGILDFFTVRVYSYEFDFRKPKPAVKTGMQAVLKAAYTNAGKEPPKGAWKINRLCELPSLIEKINAETSH